MKLDPSTPLLCMTLHSFHIGGCESQFLSLCKSLQDHNIDLIVLHSHTKGSFTLPSTETLKFFAIPWFFYKFRLIPFYLSYFFKWKLQRYPSLFHCHAISYFTEQILWFAQKKKIPALLKITTEGDVSDLKKKSVYLSINPNIKAELENFPVEKKKIISIHNAVDPDRFCPVSDEEKGLLKEELGLPKEMRYITMIARFDSRKRIKDLIASWAKIKDRFPQHMLLLVGDGPERTSCEGFVSELNMQKRVLCTGFQSKIERFFQITDLFAFSSEREGLPNVLLEAMSCRLPIVATAIAGIKEIIHPLKNGLLFPPKDVIALSDALSYMLEHPVEATQMAHSARETILQYYSFEKTTPKFIDIYANYHLTPMSPKSKG